MTQGKLKREIKMYAVQLDGFTHRSYLAKIVLWAVFEFENDLLHNIISDLFTFFTSLLIDKLDHLDSIWN